MTIQDNKKDGYLTLKEASELFGYSPDYIGQLIRKGKIEGKQVYANVAWMTTEAAMRDYLASLPTQGVEKKQDRSLAGLLENIELFFFSGGGMTALMWIFRVIVVLLVCGMLALFYFLSISFDRHLERRAQERLSRLMEGEQHVTVPAIPSGEHLTYEKH